MGPNSYARHQKYISINIQIEIMDPIALLDTKMNVNSWTVNPYPADHDYCHF